MRINNISFNGIKVTKPQTKVVAQQPRAEQKRILDGCKQQLELLDEVYKSKQTTTSVDSSFVSLDDCTKYSDLWSAAEDKNAEKGTVIRNETSIWDAKMAYANRMFDTVRRSIHQVREADKKDSTDDSTYVVIPNNQGIKKIAGYKNELEVIQTEFIDRVNAEKQGNDVDIFGSILFFGPYSNGKTHVTEAIAQSTNCIIKPVVVISKTRQQTMEKIKAEAKKSEERFNKDRTRTIIFIDEVDKLIGKNSPISKEFEEFIKTCSKKYHCSVFAATNNPLDLSINMSDPDVFPIKMSIDPPNEENMEEVYKYYLKDAEVEDIDYKALVATTKQREEETGSKFNVGQIKAICNNTFFNKAGQKITQDDIIDSILSVDPEITPQLDAKFARDYKQLIEV